MIVLENVIGHIVATNGLVAPSDLRLDCSSALAARPELLRTCYYEAFVRTSVFRPIAANTTGFLPDVGRHGGQCAPTWDDTWYVHAVAQGYVSDGNAYASGGISGHAGLFSSGVDVATFAQRLLTATTEDGWVPSDVIADFVECKDTPAGSTRALGWDTNRYSALGTYTNCGSLHPETFMHLGYTGTMICIDPVSEVYLALLSARVYPDDETSLNPVRGNFSSAVAQALGVNQY
jgi:CubicO group peptidase (beta-lactamase class C family)